MMLTCPACTVRYVVADGAIGPKGRRVRCAHCGHQWMQEPEAGLDDILFGENIVFPHEKKERDLKERDFEQRDRPVEEENISAFEAILRQQNEDAPIPQGVRPSHEEHDPVLAQLGRREAVSGRSFSRDALAGFVTAGVFYLFVAGLFLMFQPQISKAWPASNLFYNMFGMKPVLPGEGLALDSLNADFTDGKIILKGDIINLKSADLDVPPVIVTFADAKGGKLATHIIPPPVARLTGEGKAPFESVYDDPSGTATIKEAANVTFAFFAGEAPAPIAGAAKPPTARDVIEKNGIGLSHTKTETSGDATHEK